MALACHWGTCRKEPSITKTTPKAKVVPSSPSIKTLIPDIQKRITSGEPFDEETVVTFGKNLATKLANRLAETRGRPTLRLSNVGTPCERKLWYSINTPEAAAPLSASTRLKFLFGDILEEVVLFLARAAGHKVEKEQEAVHVSGVKGHIDAIVDGELVDVKSASTYSFKKFKEGGLKTDDAFGYLHQLGAYLSAVGGKRGHFIAVDKTLGNLTLDTHDKSDVNYEELVEHKKKIIALPEPPPRAYQDEADGKSGNRKLGIACSYCSFKQTCFPGLRTFAYSRGPVFLTKVDRVPDVPELTGVDEEV